jgi:hypothetical protein
VPVTASMSISAGVISSVIGLTVSVLSTFILKIAAGFMVLIQVMPEDRPGYEAITTFRDLSAGAPIQRIVILYLNSWWIAITLATYSENRDELRRVFRMQFVIAGEQLTKDTTASLHEYEHLSIIANLAMYSSVVGSIVVPSYPVLFIPLSTVLTAAMDMIWLIT